MIEPEIQARLRNKYNPEGSSLRRQQKVMLDILIHFDRVCKQNGIEYWLSCGTALGAARHGGFIPWDDDLDVEMMRDDYLRLEKILEHDRQYDFQSYKTDPFYCCPYSKLRDKNSIIKEHEQDTNYRYKGLYIDIFPLEFVPSEKIGTITAMLRRSVMLYGARAKSNMQKKLYFFFKKTLFMTFSFCRFVSKPFKTTELRYTYGGGFLKEKRDVKSIFPLGKIEFEGHIFPAAHDMEKYLTLLYGDYMKLPNEEDIENHITNVVFK